MLPLSTSSREAVWFLRPSFLERRMENTDAASVELITAPVRKLSRAENQCQVAEQRCEQRGDRHAQGGQHHRPGRRRPGRLPAGTETTVEHDEISATEQIRSAASKLSNGMRNSPSEPNNIPNARNSSRAAHPGAETGGWRRCR